MRMLLTTLVPLALACASAPEPTGPGPMRPLGPDVELDAAPPLDITDESTTRRWLSERITAANAGQRERVRLPVVRRAAAFGCDCPEFAIAPTADNGPFYWVHLSDLTSAGIPHGAWVGWVDGHFTGELRTYRSTDAGGSDVDTPVFNVYRQSRRGPDEPPEARVVAEKK